MHNQTVTRPATADIIDYTMEHFKVTDVKTTELKDPRYVIPFQLQYKENGVYKTRDLIKVHDSVDIIIFNITRNVLVCVKQFRPGVYLTSIPVGEKMNIDTNKYPAELGLTLEFCAGIVDKDKPLVEIAKEEVLEECGYEVATENIHKILTFRQGVGHNGGLQTFYYTEVTDSMKVKPGGGNAEEGEFIEVVELTIEEARTFLNQDKVNASSDFLYGLLWFFKNKSNRFV